ncbi:hypothetical protein EV363DRAFT_1303562 [Boletus edulis]|nr:hypothetical protein EV363DRAFT_1303562 [Boletus edulis]
MLSKVKDTHYYGVDVHRSAFVLPEFARMICEKLQSGHGNLTNFGLTGWAEQQDQQQRTFAESILRRRQTVTLVVFAIQANMQMCRGGHSRANLINQWITQSKSRGKASFVGICNSEPNMSSRFGTTLHLQTLGSTSYRKLNGILTAYRISELRVGALRCAATPKKKQNVCFVTTNRSCASQKGDVQQSRASRPGKADILQSLLETGYIQDVRCHIQWRVIQRLSSLGVLESHHSPPRPFSLGKHVLDRYPTSPGSDGRHVSPHLTKRQKVLKTTASALSQTSFMIVLTLSKLDLNRSCNVKDHMNKKILGLARMSREVYVAKMQYQRLRMRELEMLKDVMGDELEETRGNLNQMEHQVGHIHRDLSNTGTNSEGGIEQWACLIPTRLPLDSVLSHSSCAFSDRHSDNGDSTTSSSSSIPPSRCEDGV